MQVTANINGKKRNDPVAKQSRARAPSIAVDAFATSVTDKRHDGQP
jgi:hypothetical protein